LPIERGLRSDRKAELGMTAPVAAAGWFPDPDGLPTQRWWDGKSWTEQLAPLPAPTQAAAAAPQSATLTAVAEPERLLAQARFSSASWLIPLVLVVVLLGLVAAFSAVAKVAAVAVLVAVLGAIIVGLAFLNCKSSRFALTSRRVSGQTGFLHKRGIDTALSKIEGITIERGLGGSLFGYGTVVVRGVGGSRVGFQYIANHADFRQSLDSEVFQRI
jgi:hypothetical protein